MNVYIVSTSTGSIAIHLMQGKFNIRLVLKMIS